LKEAIAHILEPPEDPTGSAWKQQSGGRKLFDEVYNTPSAPQTTSTSVTATTTQQRSTCKIIFVLVDPETPFQEANQDDGDTNMKEEEEKSWFYGDQDIRGILYEATRSMEMSIKKRKYVRLLGSRYYQGTQRTYTEI
jgi:hypothetical protein